MLHVIAWETNYDRPHCRPHVWSLDAGQSLVTVQVTKWPLVIDSWRRGQIFYMCVLLLPVSWRVRPVRCEEFVNQDESLFFWTTTTSSSRVARHDYEFQFRICDKYYSSLGRLLLLLRITLQWRWIYFVVEILCEYSAAKKKKKKIGLKEKMETRSK